MTTSTHSSLIRKQFLISAESISKLEKLAKARNTSASEIVRQAIDSYNPYESEEMDMPELMELVGVKLKEAIRSTKKANHQVERTLKSLEHGDSK